MQRRRLGRTDLEVSPIGLGCLQFSGSNGVVARLFPPLAQDAVTAVVRAAVDGGMTWFDTAELYGRGASERALSTALRDAGVAPGEVVIATKWLPLARTAGSIARTIDARLDCLQGFPLDLHQIHMPIGGVSPIRAQVRAMAQLRQAGKIRAVGVSNFTARQMSLAHDTLRAEGTVLAANQVQLNLLNRKVERSGVVAAARRLGVTLIAHTPLANGVLTGRYHEDPGRARTLLPLRRGLHRSMGTLSHTAPLVEELRAIGRAYGVSVSQAALSWVITYYGDTVVAIPGASKPWQATEAAAAIDLRLTGAELARLDDLSRRIA